MAELDIAKVTDLLLLHISPLFLIMSRINYINTQCIDLSNFI